MTRRLQQLERLERGASFGDRDLGPVGEQRGGQRQPRLRELHRHLRAREAGERLAEAGVGIAGARGDADLAAGERRGGCEVRGSDVPPRTR